MPNLIGPAVSLIELCILGIRSVSAFSSEPEVGVAAALRSGGCFRLESSPPREKDVFLMKFEEACLAGGKGPHINHSGRTNPHPLQ